MGFDDHGMNNHGAPTWYQTVMREDVEDTLEDASGIPTSQFYSEGNGGEFRKSYHGYPRGYAQLIESPEFFHIQPMQIDTKNRHYNGSDFKPDLLPKVRKDFVQLYSEECRNKTVPPGLRGPRRRCVLRAAGVPLHRPRGEEGEAGCKDT